VPEIGRKLVCRLVSAPRISDCSLDDPYDSQSSPPVTPLDLRRYRAERLLRKDFAGLRAKVVAIVRSQLRTKGIKLDPADLDACYAQAWHGLYATLLEGEAVENPSAWLVLVTYRRAIDEHRAKGRAGVVEGEDRRSYPRESEAPAQDLAAELDDRVRLRHVFEGMRASLSPRECQAASLCYLQGLSRAEAAERMGIGEGRMRKLMEGTGAGRPGVAGKLGELLETIGAGGWCEQQGSLMRAYAFGILDPEGERHARAAAHCRECPACRAHVASLRGLASVLPLPLLPQLAAAGGGALAAQRGRVSARRIGTYASRLGGKAGGGWSGLSGPLAAQLAVTVALLVGAGYAVLGSRAHGSPRRSPQPAQLVPSPIAIGVLSRSPFVVLRRAHARTRAGRPKRRHTNSPGHGPRPTAARGTTAAAVGATEFGPERAAAGAGAQTLSPGASSAVPRSGAAPASEFGLE
jgi:DNA-directed RNA polymerase specialized sigma24 family protein